MAIRSLAVVFFAFMFIGFVWIPMQEEREHAWVDTVEIQTLRREAPSRFSMVPLDGFTEEADRARTHYMLYRLYDPKDCFVASFYVLIPLIGLMIVAGLLKITSRLTQTQPPTA